MHCHRLIWTAWVCIVAVLAVDESIRDAIFNPLVPGLRLVSTQSTSKSTSASQSTSWSNRDTIIVSCVVGTFGLTIVTIVAIGIWFFVRNRRRGNSRWHGGVSPVDDDEIASWRGSSVYGRNAEKYNRSTRIRAISTVSVAEFAGWRTSENSPASVGTAVFNFSPQGQWAHSPARAYFPGASSPLVAQAPNARVGLTDEVVPGADPFIKPTKRPSSRLSKPPPGHGHTRNKSRRSSASGKSIWSFRSGYGGDGETPTIWHDPKDALIRTHLPGHRE